MATNDPTQDAPVPAASVPTAAPDMQSWMISQLAPVAQQAAQQATTQATSVLSGVLSGVQSDLAQVQADVAANRVQLEAAVAKAGGSVLTNVEQDPLTQRIVVCAVVGALLIAGLMILGFALLGNATANRWIAGAPLALGAALLWVSKAGVSLTKPAVKA